MPQGPFLRKYGVETTVNFALFEIDGVDFRVDAAHAAGDSLIMKDEGAEANTDNGFTDEGNGYSIVVSATEMEAARIVIYLIDSATKAWLDDSIVIETYGNASAMHGMDFDDAVRGGMTALPNAAADAAGGLPISDAGGLDLDTQIGTDINAILTDTGEIGTAGAGLTDLGGMSTGMKAEVESEANDALVALNLDHLAKTATGSADMTNEVVDNTIISRILANGDTSAFVPSTDGLQLIRDKQTDIETDTAEIGAAGAGLSDLGGMSTGMKAEVESEANDALVAQKLDHLVAVAESDDPVDNSILAKLAASDGDWSGFSAATDALEAIRDKQTDIETDTAEIGAAGAGLSDLGGMSTGMKAEVESEANDALIALNLDHLMKEPTAAADMTTEIVDNTALSRILANGDTSAFAPSTDGLQLIRDKQTDIETDTAVIGALGAGLTAVPWNSAWDAEVQSECADALTAYDPPTDTEMDTAFAALNDVAVTEITQRQIPDSVPADGTRPTIEQSLYMIVQFLMERAVSDTTVTVKKVDGSTALLTLILDDASDPTSITRAT